MSKKFSVFPLWEKCCDNPWNTLNRWWFLFSYVDINRQGRTQKHRKFRTSFLVLLLVISSMTTGLVPNHRHPNRFQLMVAVTVNSSHPLGIRNRPICGENRWKPFFLRNNSSVRMAWRQPAPGPWIFRRESEKRHGQKQQARREQFTITTNEYFIGAGRRHWPAVGDGLGKMFVQRRWSWLVAFYQSFHRKVIVWLRE